MHSRQESTGNYQCWNFKSDNTIREKYLNNINKHRLEIPSGNLQGKSGNFPKGKNVYKLFWDCLLENEAQKVVDKCDENAKAPEGKDVAMVLKKQPLTTCNTNPLFKQAVDDWWKVVNGEDNTKIPTNTAALKSFATLAYGTATRVGCAQKNCNGDLYMACMVYKGIADGEQVYQEGSGCGAAKDCETYQGSKCNNNMCIAGYIDPSATTAAPQPPETTTPTGTTTETKPAEPTTTPLFPVFLLVDIEYGEELSKKIPHCDDNSIVSDAVASHAFPTTFPRFITYFPFSSLSLKLRLFSGESKDCPADQAHMSSDTIRKLFVDLQNGRRSEIAKGTVMMGNDVKCRTAVHMWKLVS
ncbi:hypothetical protein Y032_0105g3666 [Ancylostoma ceylanicum]|uniref:SCP domain-containing protein n=2 Tax=Ancylostoma ceylanicum TaxID=53326 RepID=A0A016TGC7_9BILA|nr:hypothetical protein Y032_0105g3666 [Ancylostoma ceylanicum]